METEFSDQQRFRKAGHQEILGETIAKFELFRAGWNPYNRFLDEEKVDLVVRRRTKGAIEYADIQVKQLRLYSVSEKYARETFDVTSWGFFRRDAMKDAHEHLVIAIVLVHREAERGATITDFQGDIFYLTAKRFGKLLGSSPGNEKEAKLYFARLKRDPSRWFCCTQWNKVHAETMLSSAVEVTDARQDVSVVSGAALRHETSFKP